MRLHVLVVGGMYPAYRGNDREAAEDLRGVLEADPLCLYAPQTLAWLEARLLKKLRH